MSLSPRTLVETAVRAAGEKRGDDIRALDISGLTILSDYFVLVSGRSTTHVRAIADHIREKLGELGAKAPRSEGYREGLWILLDYGDVVVHVFTQSERDFYNLERLWGDAPVVHLPAGLQRG